MHDRTEWKRGEPGPRKIGKKTYVNLVEFSRSCATCGKPFSIHVTAKIANGGADSNSFGLKNCLEHRRGGPKDTTELDQLRMANNVMREELDGLYARDKELFAENQVLKARLVVYETPNADPFRDQVIEALVRDASRTLTPKMPWEL